MARSRPLAATTSSNASSHSSVSERSGSSPTSAYQSRVGSGSAMTSPREQCVVAMVSDARRAPRARERWSPRHHQRLEAPPPPKLPPPPEKPPPKPPPPRPPPPKPPNPPPPKPPNGPPHQPPRFDSRRAGAAALPCWPSPNSRAMGKKISHTPGNVRPRRPKNE